MYKKLASHALYSAHALLECEQFIESASHTNIIEFHKKYFFFEISIEILEYVYSNIIQ